MARAVVRILTRADPQLREPEHGSGSEVGELRAGMQAGMGCRLPLQWDRRVRDGARSSRLQGRAGR